MHFSSASLAAATALAALFAAPAVGSPNSGPSKNKAVADGPNKLYECPCKPIVDAMVKCQTRKGPNGGIRDCVCVPNPDGWYGYLHVCRDCLSSNGGGGSSPADPFFANLAGTITQLFVSCTNAGGGVNSPDGASICASNSAFERCASLKTGGKEASWASSEVFKGGESSNGTFVVDIPGDPAASASSSAAATATTGAASTTASGTTGANTTPGTQTTSTTSTPGATKPSSAMGYAGSRSQVAGVMGLAFAVGVAVLV